MWTPDASIIITAEQKAEAARKAALLVYKAAFDARLDMMAQSKGYDNRISIGTYATSTNPVYVAEAQAFIEWRDAALASMFAQLAAVEAGGNPPTVEEFLAALPVINWP